MKLDPLRHPRSKRNPACNSSMAAALTPPPSALIGTKPSSVEMASHAWLNGRQRMPRRLPRSILPFASAPASPARASSICVGLNYSDHAKESGMPIPAGAYRLLQGHQRPSSAPNDDARSFRRNSKKTDWEVELAFVIGKKASYVSEDDALSHVAGYAVHNDYSEREWQLERGGQWVKGKSCDTFAPIGPFLATRDEIADPQNLSLWLKLNGKTIQNSSTAQMIFGVKQLVSYLSQFMTLLPGDVITTGTPPGVGLGFEARALVPEAWRRRGTRRGRPRRATPDRAGLELSRER